MAARRWVVGAAIIVAVAAAGYGVFRHNHPTWSQSSPAYARVVDAFYTGVVALDVGDETHGDQLLATAVRLAPEEPAAWADLGIYYLRTGALDKAESDLRKAANLAPQNAQIQSLLGVLASHNGRFDQAQAYFAQALQRDPSDPQTAYQLITALRQQGTAGETDADKRLAELARSRPSNEFLQIEDAQSLARQNKNGELLAVLAAMKTMSSNWPHDAQQNLAALTQAARSNQAGGSAYLFTELGNLLINDPKYRGDQAAVKPSDERPGRPLEHFLVLPNPAATPAPADSTLRLDAIPPSTAVHAFFVMPAILQPAIPDDVQSAFQTVKAHAEGPVAQIALEPDGIHVLNTQPGQSLRLLYPGDPAETQGQWHHVMVHDMNYDFLPDIVVAGGHGLRIFAQTEQHAFRDATGSAKLPVEVTTRAYRGVWAGDYDSDGDLDIIAAPVSGPVIVLRNNGDGTYKKEDPFPDAPSNVVDAVWADINGDGAPDIAFLTADRKVVVYQNLRAGQFRRVAAPPVSDGVALTAGDPFHTGTVGLTIVTASKTALQLDWGQTMDAPSWSTRALASGLPQAPLADISAAWADMDNNGGLDLVVSSSRGTTVLLAQPKGPLKDVPIGKDICCAIPYIDQDQGLPRMSGLTPKSQPGIWQAAGAAGYAWQTIRPRANYKERPAAGLPAAGQRMNPFAIGGEVEVRSGLLYNKLPIMGPTVHVGLGRNRTTNYLRILWPNGDSQAQGEFDIAASEVAVAFQRLKASCPWLFAWDGHRMAMVTDCIWRSPLGLKINAQATAGIVQTQDWVKIRGDQLVPHDGFYDLRICAELWETHFFDHLSLMTVDHPASTQVYVDERFSIPPPPLAVVPVQIPVPVANARDDRRQDVTAIVAQRDGRYLGTFGHGQYQGITRDHYVEASVPDSMPRSGPLWLIANGWIHPTDSSINVAISQGRAEQPQGLSLEVEDTHGKFVVRSKGLGFPEGKIKTVLINLSNAFIPGAPRRFRLRTNLEIYWDSLQVAQGAPATPLRTHKLAAMTADLTWRGFSRTHQVDENSPELPDYAPVASIGQKWRDLEGRYTRYGDVKPLLRKVDDRYVIMNAGDELRLRFAEQAPPPTGWTRDYVLVGDGWVKDGDFNTEFSRTVLPLPAHDIKDYRVAPTTLDEDPVFQRHRSDWQMYQTRPVRLEAFRAALLPPTSR